VRIVYVAHPLGSGPDREANRANAAKWCAWVAMQGFAPVADWIVLSGVLDESADNRTLGLRIDLALIARCDEVWLVGGRVSPGMRIEADEAERLIKPILDLTHMGWRAP
jgi:hypothetical protein